MAGDTTYNLAPMVEHSRKRSNRRRPQAALSYWEQSKRPLHVLVFLLPLIVAYELGLVLILQSDQGIVSNVAHVTLLRFFNALGIEALSGLYLGGIAIVVVLLVWHLLLRDSWKLNGSTLLGMTLESIVLTLPLIVLGLLITQSAISLVSIHASATPEQQMASLGVWGGLTISIGAGLYEELMFRMLLIAIVHTLLVDLGRLSSNVGAAIAIVVSAAAFTWYHPLQDETGTFSMRKLMFYFIAGLYFGCLFVFRGFGIVVGVHALYDIIMVTLLALNDDA
jgi:membrane protease YdiL (CAAX protease family)